MASVRASSGRWRAMLAVGLALGGAAAGAFAGDGPRTKRLPPREEARIELGRRLFFDPRVSRAGMRSCADCHDPEHGFGDRERFSRDDRGPTHRHSQTLVDAADNPSSHWDGAFRRVEDLVSARVTLTQRGRISEGHELAGAAPRSGLAAEAKGTARILDGDRGGAAPDGDGGARPDRPAPPSGEVAAASTEPDDTGVGRGEGDGSAKGGGTSYRAPEAAPAEPPPTTTPSEGTPSPTPPPSAAPGSGVVPAPGAPSGVAGKEAPPEGLPPEAPLRGEDPFQPPAWTPDAERLEFLHHDLDVATLPAADRVLEAAGRYREGFLAAFGSPDVTIARISESVAAYARSIRSGTSAWDRYAAGDETALDAAARRGLDLFRGKGACAGCHTMGGARAAFTDYEFHDTGVAWNGLPFGDVAAREASFAVVGDGGAGDLTGRPRHLRAFKTPTLRDVARRAPYFHDGSAPTLEAAVRHYRHGTTDPVADPRLPRVAFTDREVRDLAAFLRSLTSDVRPGLAPVVWRERAPRTRLRFVDARGDPLAGLPVRVLPAGDRLPGADEEAASPMTLRTDEDGEVVWVPPLWTHVRLLLPDGLTLPEGALVPDTCRAAVVRVPVDGTVRLWLTLPAGEGIPASLVAEHTEATVFPDRRRPRTVLRPQAHSRTGAVSVVLYAALCRTDVPPRVALRLPAPRWGLDRLWLTLEPGASVRLDLAR